MEIQIKTMAEITDSRVTITITADNQAEAEQVAEKITAEPGEERIYGQISPAVAAMTSKPWQPDSEIRRRLGEREIQLSGAHKRIESLETENAAYARGIDNLTIERDAEEERANTNRAWAERAEKHKKELQEKLDDALKDVRRLTRAVESSRRAAAETEADLKRAVTALESIQSVTRSMAQTPGGQLDAIAIIISQFFAPPGPPAPPA